MKVIDFDKQLVAEGISSHVVVDNTFERLQQYKEEGKVLQVLVEKLQELNDKPYWILNFEGIRGVVEFERTGLEHPNQMGQFVGQEIFVKIFHLKQSEKGSIVSADRKAVIEETKFRIFEVIEVGQVIPSVVRGIGDSTIHIDIGGGFTVPVERKKATLSKRHTSLRNLFKIGDVLNVKVMHMDIIERTIDVSHVAIYEDIWLQAKYNVGDIVTAEIVHISNKNESPIIFAEVQPGIDALVAMNVAELPLKVGSRIRGRVSQFNPETKRLRLKFQAFI